MKRYLIHYRSPFVGPHAAYHVCEMCEHTRIIGKPNGFLFFFARLLQRMIVDRDEWADTWLERLPTRKSKIRRLRALWAVARPTPREVLMVLWVGIGILSLLALQ